MAFFISRVWRALSRFFLPGADGKEEKEVDVEAGVASDKGRAVPLRSAAGSTSFRHCSDFQKFITSTSTVLSLDGAL